MFPSSAVAHVAKTAGARTARVFSSLYLNIAAALVLVPGVSAQDKSGYINLNTSAHSYNPFVAGPVDPNNPDADKIYADINHFLPSGLDWVAWANRTAAIRSTKVRAECIGNLSMALNGLGAAYQAGANGATTLLTLLPTAGALIGAPAKELWVLYKLMPMAGILSMMLSLGGNIVPMEVNEYERTGGYFYQGIIGTHDEEPSVPMEKMDGGITQAESFAQAVKARSTDDRGSKKMGAIFCGMVLQLVWLACILVGCWFVQTGGILVWWCEMSNWAYFWFATVVISSLLENIAGVPFTRQWTIRVSRAPKVRISDDAPWVIKDAPIPRRQSDFRSLKRTATTDNAIEVHSRGSATPESGDDAPEPGIYRKQTFQSKASYVGVSQVQGEYDILFGFKKGYNTVGKVVMDPNEPWSAQSNPFYVLISIKGVQPAHAALRVFSKLLSIGVFTVGTGLFASATLITINAAVITATLIIIGGVFGRVTAMWMASVIMQDKPVVQRVVNTEYEAEQYMDAMLRIEDCVFEIQGHVVLNGRCVKRYGNRMRWSKFFGVLARPYDVTKLAMTPPEMR